MKRKFDGDKPFLSKFRKIPKKRKRNKEDLILLSDEEIKKLVKAMPNERDRLAVLFDLTTGLRVSELLGLVWNDVWVEQARPTLIVRREIAKGKKRRKIPLSARARDILALIRDLLEDRGWPTGPDDPVFQARKGKHMSPRTLQLAIQKARLKAKISSPATPHKMRHKFATDLLKHCNIRVCQTLLGHGSLQTTMIYTHVQEDELREAVDKM